MTKLLERALAEAARLPEEMQDRVGRELLTYIEKLGRLQADIDVGRGSSDEGRRVELDLEEVLARARLTAALDWLAERRVRRPQSNIDAGTQVSQMRDEESR